MFGEPKWLLLDLPSRLTSIMPTRRSAARPSLATPANSTKNESATLTSADSASKLSRRSHKAFPITPSSLTDADDDAELIKAETRGLQPVVTVTRGRKRKGGCGR